MKINTITVAPLYNLKNEMAALITNDHEACLTYETFCEHGGIYHATIIVAFIFIMRETWRLAAYVAK